MGFFSWKCAKSDKPVMSEYAVANSPWQFASDVVVLFRNGDRISGTYDGYGRVNGFEIVDLDEREWRMVIKKYYNKSYSYSYFAARFLGLVAGGVLSHVPDFPPLFSCSAISSSRMPRSTALHIS